MRIFLFIFAILSAGCSSLRTHQSSIPPKSTYSMEQATFTTPDESDWSLLQHDLHAFALGKRPGGKGESTILSAQMFKVQPAKNSRVFLEAIAKARADNDDKKRFKILSVKNEYVTFRDLPCLKYQTVSEDHKEKGIDSADFEYFKTSGYVCRYPLEYVAFQFEISHRSQAKEIPPELVRTGQQFFENIQLVDATVKRLKTIP